MSKKNATQLSYIVYPEQVGKLVTEVTAIGDIHFIQKKGEQQYNSYRLVERTGVPYYVQVGLPSFLFKELIQSGKLAKSFS